MARPSTNRLAGASAVAIVMLASPAMAAPPSLAVADGIEACPPSSSLRSAIAGALGRDPFDDERAPKIRVDVRQKDGELYAEIVVERTNQPPRSRVVSGDACADLVRAAALVAALAIQEDDARPAEPLPPAAAPPVTHAEEATAPRPGAPLRSASVVIVASGMTSLALLPRPAPGVAGNVRVRVAEGAWISARGFHLPSVTTEDNAFALGLSAGGLGACAEPLGGGGARVDWAVTGCAHVMGGALVVDDVQTPLREDATKGFFAASFSAGARARAVGPVVVEGSIESMVPFGHPTFVTTACPGTGFQQPFATLAVSLGAGVSIP